jgi:hypothetical protein
MYNNGNSSKNVTGASVVDGTLENADYADNAISGDKVDGGIISNFQSTGIDDRLATGKCIYTKNTNVGVGTSNPVYNLVVSNGGAEGLEIGTGYLGNKNLFQNYNRSTGAYVEAVNVASQYIFQTNGVEKVRFPAAGGITFNGDTAAANALDDYEEGTWTPVWRRETTNPSYNDGGSTGKYTKIGNKVTVEGTFIAWIVSSQGSGSWYFEGLPFMPSTTNFQKTAGTLGRLFDNGDVAGDYYVGLRSSGSQTFSVVNRDTNQGYDSDTTYIIVVMSLTYYV